MRIIAAVCAVCALSAPALGQVGLEYADFSSVAGLQLNNHALQQGNLLRVTPSLISQRGTVFAVQPMDVALGFETRFTFQITSQVAGGGDGIAFVIHNDPDGLAALGNHASAMGYGAFASAPAGTSIENSLVVELDTYAGSFNGTPDLSGNEISVHTGGPGDNSQDEQFSIGRANAPVNMSDGQVHEVRIVYTPGLLEIYFDGAATPLLSIPYDLLGGGTYTLSGNPVAGLPLLNGFQAYVGFAAGTGGAWQNQDVLSWEFVAPPPSACAAGTSGLSAGAAEDVLTIDGEAGGLDRTIVRPTFQSFTLALDAPSSATTPTNFILFMHLGPVPPGSGFPLGFGELCFQPVLNPTVLVLADGYGLGLGAPFFPATPTPWQFSVATPVPLDLTFQAVLDDAGSGFATSNAVRLVVN